MRALYCLFVIGCGGSVQMRPELPTAPAASVPETAPPKMEVPPAPTQPKPVTIAEGLDYPAALALDDGNVFVAVRGSGFAIGSVAMLPKNGGAKTVLANKENLLMAIAVDGND